MRTLIIFIIILIPLTHDGIIRDSSDFVEINHYYQYNEGDKVYQKNFVQIIWWEFRGGLFVNRKGESLNYPISDFVVKDFRIVWSRTSDPEDVNSITPKRYKNNWSCIFFDKEDKVLREVTSGWKTVTHTLFDPEMDNRQMVSIQGRTKLSDTR